MKKDNWKDKVFFDAAIFGVGVSKVGLAGPKHIPHAKFIARSGTHKSARKNQPKRPR